MNLHKTPSNFLPAIFGTAALAFALSSCVHRVSRPLVVKSMEVVQPGEEEPPEEEEETDVLSSTAAVRQRVLKGESKILVKIGLHVASEKILVECNGLITVSGKSGKSTWPAGSYTFRADDGVLTVNGREISRSVKLTPKSPEIYLQSRDKMYRGSFILKVAGDSKVTLINELKVDDYLKGVLTREVVVTWPLEALKAQAVASRTYLASHLGRHAVDGFDLCCDVHCQVYGGMNREHPQCNKAVEETRGEILTYHGDPIGAFFHSNCGGFTEDIQYVWGMAAEPYLVRKRCSYGTGDPRYHWRMTYSKKEILDLLKSVGVRGERLSSLRIKHRSPSGRAETIAIRTEAGTFDLKGNEFRIALNPEKIRSTLWTSLTPTRNGYEFTGRGWGHGIGLCQWGAKGQAEKGRSYETILKFYYPHTTLQTWSRR